MSKLDDIRKMREANYDRDQKRAGTSAVGDADEPRAEAPQREDGAHGRKGLENPPDQKSGLPGRSDHAKPAFDRATYQRQYMKDKYRPRVKAQREADAAELKRLRELVGGGK